ncbi:MAG: hypothetical protein KF850_15630 [Labilithrix sp.]|nr:hypothetical protein [Labilithrix sp.]MBX3213468.1 hypothetical protein [Labilithrix sp.]
MTSCRPVLTAFTFALAAGACRFDDLEPRTRADVVALDVFPASREVRAKPGESVSFALQAKSATGEGVDDVETFLAADESAPLTFETPSSDTKTARATTKRDAVAGLSVNGVVAVRVAVSSAAAPGHYPVFCGLTAAAVTADAGAQDRPVSRVNVVVEAPDAGASAPLSDGGPDAS